MLSHIRSQSHHPAVNLTTALNLPGSTAPIFSFHCSIFSVLFIPESNTHPSSTFVSPVPAVSLPEWVTPTLQGHRAGQCPGQQHLPEKGGPEREQHGRHRSQDAEQSPADQHHAQVRGNECRERKCLCLCTEVCIQCDSRLCPAGVWHGIATTPPQQDF